MISITDLKNKKLTLVIWNAEKEDDVRVFRGEMIEGRDGLYFINELLNWNLHLDEDKISRIKEIPDDVKEMLLNADYCINLSLGKLPDEPLDEYIKTGMKWD